MRRKINITEDRITKGIKGGVRIAEYKKSLIKRRRRSGLARVVAEIKSF
jgi:hypothetical protein